MPVEEIETLIVGGGQSGLAMSHMLTRRGCPHIVLERYRLAERWRTERWAGLRFQFPNWSVGLPDFSLPHDDPDGFATSAEIVDFITRYADFIAAPVRCGVAVTALRRASGSGFLAETSDGTFNASNVMIATGPYQRPVFPAARMAVPVFQVHASEYREPGQLPSGAVLIVGSGASGAQIAEELIEAGRRVYLSVGRHRRMPRRYRGRDLIWWLAELGLDRTPVEKRGPDRALPLITGANGGYTIDFRQMSARGVTLLGKVAAMGADGVAFAPDLSASLAHGDAAYTAFLDLVDAHVDRHGLNLPQESAARTAHADPPCVRDPLSRIDFSTHGIGAIIWATGYGYDYRWIEVPVLDARSEPVHRKGVAEIPGMYFLGLQWLSKMNSSFLSGVGEDAAYLADHIADRRDRSPYFAVRDAGMVRTANSPGAAKA